MIIRGLRHTVDTTRINPFSTYRYTEVQIYEKCPNITKDKIAKNYIILTVFSTQGPEALEYIWFPTLLELINYRTYLLQRSDDNIDHLLL